MRTIVYPALFFTSSFLGAQTSGDPYRHLENMYRAVVSTQAYHVTVNISTSNGLGHTCDRETIEAFRDRSRSLTLRPGEEVLATHQAFIVVDHANRVIDLQLFDAQKESPLGPITPDPMQHLAVLRAKWRMAKVFNEPIRIRYQYAMPDGPIQTTEVIVDKRTDTLVGMRYIMRTPTTDDCNVVQLDYTFEDHINGHPFDMDRFVLRGRDGSWRPASRFQGFTLRLPPGS